MRNDPSPEHRWLEHLVGEWEFDHEFSPGAGEPKVKLSGRERVRMMGDLWAVFEGGGPMPGGEEMSYVMLLGFDPKVNAFVGTWTGSPMAHMFVYEGVLDASQKVLPLNTTGPSFKDPTAMARYQDVIGLVGDGRRTLTSQLIDENGVWVPFMEAAYTRL